MKTPVLSKRARIFCSGVCFCFAYAPIFLHFLEEREAKKNYGLNELAFFGNNAEIINTAVLLSNSLRALSTPQYNKNNFLTSLGGISDSQSHSRNINSSVNSSKNSSISNPQQNTKLAKTESLKTNTAATNNETVIAKEMFAQIKEEPDLGKIENSPAFQQSDRTTVAQIIENSPVLTRKNVNIAGYSNATLVKGKIKSNFYVDARNLGVPANVVDSVVKNLSSKVNFKSSLKRGDKFEVIYSSKKEMVYARIVTKRLNVSVYRFSDGKSGEKNASYYFANGEKCIQQSNGSFFGRPLAGKLAVSCKFGLRKHPITGKIHNHNGVDLRAAYGAPVYAVCDGIVKRASRYAGYGNCIDLQHIDGYSSRYAHLSRYAVRCGNRVKKGQIIGYVGASGLATGAHLHLELAKNNRVVNPLSVKMIPPKKVVISHSGKRKFDLLKVQIDNAAASI